MLFIHVISASCYFFTALIVSFQYNNEVWGYYNIIIIIIMKSYYFDTLHATLARSYPAVDVDRLMKCKMPSFRWTDDIFKCSGSRWLETVLERFQHRTSWYSMARPLFSSNDFYRLIMMVNAAFY